MFSKKTDQKAVFSNTTTIENLMSFLNARGMGHTAFYHYTDLNTLNKILNGKKLLLSRADTLNDFHEGGRSSDIKNIFITSFSFFSQESIAMWSMYAWPYCDGVRLRIDGKSMRNNLKDFNTTVRLKYIATICKEIKLFRGIPVGRFLQRVPVQIEDFEQGEV